MVPPFKYYFYPFLNNLLRLNTCRLSDLAGYISSDLKLSKADIYEFTKGGKITKHNSRVNYCASYLKRMGLVEAFSIGSYRITERGKSVLNKYGKDLTLEHLRELPEYISTQVNLCNKEVVYVKSHKRGNRTVGPYLCKKSLLKAKNPNIVEDISQIYNHKSSDITDEE